MAVSTYTLMRTFTSVKVIATTVTAQPEVVTATVDQEPTTVVQSAEEPITNSSQSLPSSSVHTSILNSTITLPVPTTSAAPTSNVPTSDLSDPTSSESTSSKSTSSTSTSTSTRSPTFSSAIFSASSVPAADTPLFAKRPTDAIGESQNPQVPTTTSADILPSESTQETSSQTTLQDVLQTTEESAPETTESTTSQSIEKAILQPVPGTSTAVTTADSVSSIPSNLSSAISTTFQTQLESTTAASAPESTQSSVNSTPDDSDSGITNPQSTFTTATLPGGRLTTISLDATAASEQSSSPSETDVSVTDQNSNDTPSTPIVVGSIFGAFAAISLIVCLLWFFRRRMSKKRRSTLLTPLSLPPGGSRGEKKYEIDAESLGPTARSTKLAAALSFYPKKFSLKLSHSPANNSTTGVNMNRGNSQFLDPIPSHSRNASVESYGHGRQTSGRPGWWSRVIEDTSSEDLTVQDMAERANYPGPAYFPSMDESRLDREAQQRRMSRGHSVSSWTDGALSPNPFTDANTLSAGSSTKYYPAPLQPNNPFADSNSIAPPATAQVAPTGYVQEVQRSRGQSTVGGPGPQAAARRGNPGGPFYRDSAATNTPFETRRNKTHSNPFDLEIDGPQPPMGPPMRLPPRVPVASSIYDQRPGSGRTRADSFTSHYASGPGFAKDWSAMGPVSSRWGSTVGYVPIGHVRSESDGSIIGSSGVGQAM
ncbi:hypothetical protein G7Z17_g13393 [Cylindrodendrum hubeiense]|uniref:Uncharacterized protein n=1 Tax=Cylindrodendrum hubeiense TaxID=595255 RepID=A0A9P5H021_9HYPO|nr:hypothetical protein G7Z17_g13393 [Cylindrodendrum hubeiense]